MKALYDIGLVLFSKPEAFVFGVASLALFALALRGSKSKAYKKRHDDIRRIAWFSAFACAIGVLKAWGSNSIVSGLVEAATLLLLCVGVCLFFVRREPKSGAPSRK